MEKRGVTASELSTVRKKPEYRADFVIWDLMFLQRCKGEGGNCGFKRRFGTLCFYKGAKVGAMLAFYEMAF